MSRGMYHLPGTTWTELGGSFRVRDVCHRGGHRYAKGEIDVSVKCPEGEYWSLNGRFRVELVMHVPKPCPAAIPPKPKSVRPLIADVHRCQAELERDLASGAIKLPASRRHDVDVTETHRPDGKKRGMPHARHRV